jgi:hypothetical protein
LTPTKASSASSSVSQAGASFTLIAHWNHNMPRLCQNSKYLKTLQTLNARLAFIKFSIWNTCGTVFCHILSLYQLLLSCFIDFPVLPPVCSFYLFQQC